MHPLANAGALLFVRLSVCSSVCLSPEKRTQERDILRRVSNSYDLC